MESVVFNSRRSGETVVSCLNKFHGSKDMVNERLMHINAERQTRDAEDGLKRLVQINFEDC